MLGSSRESRSLGAGTSAEADLGENAGLIVTYMNVLRHDPGTRQQVGRDYAAAGRGFLYGEIDVVPDVSIIK
ncbi:uncharacterized protein GLRG_04464 [Colletotrichum graminicola M1.001]|uniref:Uncharacterized protein n=1 Tax=Colletotrichum graminicola (strain M1.001 / M2 / FGSC 10212) TaxID=645133 RepID=E3QEL4_COLGM|nr:uncharacterized protein GLRG_04464 [Colletotrichum graminicola M1.001]EFQ29320.1 hypothetical protein GLRG_04464 [Colletotrichum graminicola M1.001]